MGVILLESELTNELGSLKLLTSCKGKNEYAWLSEEFNFSKAFVLRNLSLQLAACPKMNPFLNLHSLLLEDTFPLFHIPLHLLVSQKQRSFVEADSSILASVADNSNRQSMAFSTVQQ